METLHYYFLNLGNIRILVFLCRLSTHGIRWLIYHLVLHVDTNIQWSRKNSGGKEESGAVMVWQVTKANLNFC